MLGAVVSACTDHDWSARSYDDPTKLAQAICDDVVLLDAEPLRVKQLAALLDDRRVLYAGEPDVEEAARAVTVRDAAYLILEVAGVLPPDIVDRRVK